jgi:selenocysteine lyase/cysteine desulfurase
VPTFSFTHQHRKSSAIAEALSREGIFCQWGHNYAFEPAKALGLDLNDGVVRVGFAHYNTENEVQDLLACLRKVLA